MEAVLSLTGIRNEFPIRFFTVVKPSGMRRRKHVTQNPNAVELVSAIFDWQFWEEAVIVEGRVDMGGAIAAM